MVKRTAVVLLCPFYPPNLGGVETHLQLLTDYLVGKNYLISVLTYQPLVTKSPYKKHEKKSKSFV